MTDYDEIRNIYSEIPRNNRINSKGNIQKSNKYFNEYFEISNAFIETDTGLKEIYWWQKTMLNQIINNKNTFFSNQSNCLYGNYTFHEPRKIGKFYYNMILLENSYVYQYNITTGKIRKINYNMVKKVKKVSHKRKREK